MSTLCGCRHQGRIVPERARFVERGGMSRTLRPPRIKRAALDIGTLF
jgi:hypothetical protein